MNQITTVNRHLVTKDSKAKTILYWVITALVILELFQGTLWAFNLVNKGAVSQILQHLGYPPYLAFILGSAYFLAAIAIIVPGFPVLKEWAYSGLISLYTGAFISHLYVGDSGAQLIMPVIFWVLVLLSWALRPAKRKVPLLS